MNDYLRFLYSVKTELGKNYTEMKYLAAKT